MAISKYVAGRPKDQAFNEGLLRHGLVSREVLLERLKRTKILEDLRLTIERQIRGTKT